MSYAGRVLNPASPASNGARESGGLNFARDKFVLNPPGGSQGRVLAKGGQTNSSSKAHGESGSRWLGSYGDIQKKTTSDPYHGMSGIRGSTVGRVQEGHMAIVCSSETPQASQ
ncbi:hypothetical protein EG329_000852 [Mollisiaceae sp. DMI_Dod_QoI]|nr:hypothetical protein EG329_000852 [Helotiales sp. DMI_Dod_QoI]